MFGLLSLLVGTVDGIVEPDCPLMLPALRHLTPVLVECSDYSVYCVLCDKSLSCARSGYRHGRIWSHVNRYKTYCQECHRLGVDCDQPIVYGRVRSDVPVDDVHGPEWPIYITAAADSTGLHSGIPDSVPDESRDIDQVDPEPLPALGAGAEEGQSDGGASDPSTPGPFPGSGLPAQSDLEQVDIGSLASVFAAASSDLAAAVQAGAASGGFPAANALAGPSAGAVASIEHKTGCHDRDYDSDEVERLPFHDENIPAGPVRRDDRPPGQYDSHSDLYVRLLVLSCRPV